MEDLPNDELAASESARAKFNRSKQISSVAASAVKKVALKAVRSFLVANAWWIAPTLVVGFIICLVVARISYTLQGTPPDATAIAVLKNQGCLTNNSTYTLVQERLCVVYQTACNSSKTEEEKLAYLNSRPTPVTIDCEKTLEANFAANP